LTIFSLRYRWSREERFPLTNINSLFSINHISIQNELEATHDLIYFPHVTKLTIFPHSNRTYHSLSTVLDRIIPLVQLTDLIVNYPKFCVGRLVELLYYAPSIRTLTVHSISFHKITSPSIQESQAFETASKKSRITNVTITEYETLEHVKLFCNLCPQLQQLTVGTAGFFLNRYIPIVKFLLEDYKDKTHHLFFLCCTNADPHTYRSLRTTYPSDDISIKHSEGKLYLWR